MFRVRRAQVDAVDSQGAVQPCLSWIRLRLVNDEGEPYSGESYQATLTNGAKEDKLDQNGGSWHRYIPPGQCQAEFSKILEAVERWQVPPMETKT
ncbi:hypothetical protein [Chondromyces apiculatus]|uniref:Uncharacterized protein n=1 Tax=Chondromyces apiculatus DSM 436 TaxID=1192034 RepID=A0A017TFP3_9BACT|nr:hypothetical protein [Chondromyces apiculatus]EYF08093.1 Hypothetical protein CAP_5853 [Chondromyces apiculatus DSM 436]